MIERNFKSIDELLNHLSEVMAQAEAAEAAQAEQAGEPCTCAEESIDDWELRRHVVAYVVDKIGFGNFDEFKAYVEFIYEFMAEACEE